MLRRKKYQEFVESPLWGLHKVSSTANKPSKAMFSQLWTLSTSVTDLHCPWKTWSTTSKANTCERNKKGKISDHKISDLSSNRAMLSQLWRLPTVTGLCSVKMICNRNKWKLENVSEADAWGRAALPGGWGEGSRQSTLAARSSSPTWLHPKFANNFYASFSSIPDNLCRLLQVF